MCGPSFCIRPAPSSRLAIAIALVVFCHVNVVGAMEQCTLCIGGERIAFPSKQLGAGWLEWFTNCSVLEKYASSLEKDSMDCFKIQSLSTICGCPIRDEACRLCPGHNITKPTKTLELYADGSGIPTCEQVEAYLHSVNATSSECGQMQSIASECGCPHTVVSQDDSSCKLCVEGMVTTPNKTLNYLAKDFDEIPTCSQVEAYAQTVDANSKECSQLHHGVGVSCGCNNSEYWRRFAILVWIPRISGTLSLFGSLFIIVDVFKKPASQRTTKHYLLVSMSLVDCMSSIAWLLTTVPAPATDENGDPSYIYGARGNDATCTAQGFFVQLGVTSPFYNLALAVYYMLTISFSWSENRLKKRARWFLYIVPATVGLGLAFAGLPLYKHQVTTCWVADNQSLIFLDIPISVVIALATLIMIQIFLKVYRQERVVRRWIHGGSNVQSLPKKVFWQSVWYLAAFYISWPIVLVVVNVYTDFYTHYWLLCLAEIFAPLQGFINFIIYIHPRAKRYMTRRTTFSLSFLGRMLKTTRETNVSSGSIDQLEAANTISVGSPAEKETEELVNECAMPFEAASVEQNKL